MKQTWALDNTIYIKADSYDKAISKFWKKMEKAGIGYVVKGHPMPRCFVSNIESVEVELPVKIEEDVEKKNRRRVTNQRVG